MSIDLENKDNFCDIDKVDIGFTAQKALKDIKKQKNVSFDQFKIDCQNFIINLCKKLKQKCPLNFD